MAVKIAQKSIKFLSELVNGPNFDESLSSFTPSLSDSVTGRCKSVMTIEVVIGFDINNYQLLYEGSSTPSISGTAYKIVKNDIDFIAEGVTVGGDIVLDLAINGLVLGFSFTVEAITDDTLFLTANGAAPELAILYAAVNNHTLQSHEEGFISVVPNFTGLEFSYNLIENSEGNASLVSSLTNTTNIIKVRNVPTSVGGPVTGVATSKNKAWVMGDVTVELKEKVFNDNVLGQSKHGNKYEITHEFTIPYFYDGEDDSLEDTTTPPDLYNGSSSPKYIYETTWLTDINDPNTGTTVKYSSSTGASGFFDEAFNGDENPYSFSNLVYTDITENVVTDRLNIGKTTRVNFDVANSDSDFQAGQFAVMAHGAIIDSSQYASSTNDFNTVWTLETLRTAAGLGAVSNGLINDYTVTFNNSGSISVQFDVIFSADQNTVLDENQFYVIAIHLRDDAESVVMNSHKVHLLIDYNQYGKNNDIDGLFGVARFEQIPHPNILETDTGSTLGYTNAQYNVEEGALSLVEFWLDTSKDAELEELNFQVGAYNTTTQEINVLRNNNIDLSNSVLSNGIWQLRLSETVGYPLATGDQFNLKSLVIGDLVGSKQYYTLLIGYKIPWQDWLAFSAAPTSLFDPTKENDGLNNNASNYSTASTYQIRLFIEAVVLQYGIPTTYTTGSEKIDVYNYDEDDSALNDTYTCDVSTYNDNDIAIEGNIIEEGYTQVKAIFTPLVTPTFTEDVDMTEVATLWDRFAHGNNYTTISPGIDTSRLGVPVADEGWVNEQADDDDTFTNTASTIILNKLDAGLYGSTVSTITAIENMGAFYGCVSLDDYEFYQITGKMYSTSVDNDVILYQIAFMTDALGVEHTISLAATTGGIDLEKRAGYVPGSKTSDIWLFNPSAPADQANFAIVYDYGKDDFQILDDDLAAPMRAFMTGKTGLAWNAGVVGDLSFDVSRSADVITTIVDWTIDGLNVVKTFDYNLNNNPLTEKFKGLSKLGFGFHSQNLGGFKEVKLTKPSSNFWSAIRIEEENSSSDNGLYELSSDIEGDKNNLLKQLDPADIIVSSLSWNSTSFIIQALVNTLKTKSGENYKLSAEIGAVNLGALDLLTSFAWVDSADRSKLYVKLNTNVNLATVTTTGLTILNGGITVTGYVIGESIGGFITFTLSADILEDTANSFVYSGTNTITSLDNVLSLASSQILIYDI